MPREYPRSERINAQLQRELTELIRDELTDPRVDGVTVTSVETSPDMRHAKIHISLLDLRDLPQRAVAALNHAAGKLRFELKRRLSIKHIPELHFHADMSAADADQMNRLIRQARASDRVAAAERGEPNPDGESAAGPAEPES